MRNSKIDFFNSLNIHAMKIHFHRAAMTLLIPAILTGCTAVTVAGATVGAALAVTGVAVKTTGAAVGAVIPDGDQENEEQNTHD